MPSLEKARKLLESGEGMKYLEVKDDEGRTPLHCAAIYDNSGELVDLFLLYGANIEARDNLGCSPLIWASANNNPSATRVLVRHGANIKAQHNDGFTALHGAFCFGYKEVAEIILTFVMESAIESSSSLSLGLGKGLEEARNLVMNIRNKDGQSALDRAESDSQTEIIQWWETFQREREEQKQREEQVSLDSNHPIFNSIALEELEDFEREMIVQYGSEQVYRTKTMRDIVHDVITPICNKVNKSYAEFFLRKRKADAFVTHCWDEPFYLLVAALRAQFGNSFCSTSFWICSFSIRQGDSQLNPEELSTKLDQCPFVLALKEAPQFVVFRNSTTDLYSRIWCVCELVFADKYGKLAEDYGHPAVVLGDNSKFIDETSSWLHATASNMDDRKHILRFLLSEPGSLKRIDDLIGKLRKL